MKVEFRDALSHFAAGVTIVTAGNDDDRHGMTATAFTSVSASPPLVAVVIDRSHTLDRYLAAGAGLAVSVLAEDQRELADRFAFVKDEDRFLEGAWRSGPTGAPVLDDALAWLSCTIDATHPAGSHTIVVAAVEEVAVPRPGDAPLVYWYRDYRRLAGEPRG